MRAIAALPALAKRLRWLLNSAERVAAIGKQQARPECRLLGRSGREAVSRLPPQLQTLLPDAMMRAIRGGGAMVRFQLSERTRKFAREVGSIVLGVLIALGFGSIATGLGWRSEVADARGRLRFELGHNRQLAIWAAEEVPCVQRRLDTLAAALNEASQTRRLPPMGPIEPPGSGTWPRGVWDSTVAAQTSAHFPQREHASLSRMYRFLEAGVRIDDEVRHAWQVLDMMSGPGRPLDAVTEGNLYAALAVARRQANTPRSRLASFNRYLDQLFPPAYAQIDVNNRPMRGSTGCATISRLATVSYGSYQPSM